MPLQKNDCQPFNRDSYSLLIVRAQEIFQLYSEFFSEIYEMANIKQNNID